MIPEKVLNAIYEKMAPLVAELSRYNNDPNKAILMEFPEGFIRFDFKDKKDEISN